MQNRVSLKTVPFLVLLAVCSLVAAGQSTFPVRFDSEPLSNPTNVTQTAAVPIETARHYRKAYTWNADPLDPSVNVLDITATTDDTVVVLEVLVASKQSDVETTALRDRTIRAHWDADALGGGGQWTTITSVDLINVSSGGGGSALISTSIAGSAPLELIVRGGTNHDLVTVTIEVVANQDVAFAEFTAPT